MPHGFTFAYSSQLKDTRGNNVFKMRKEKWRGLETVTFLISDRTTQNHFNKNNNSFATVRGLFSVLGKTRTSCVL